MSKAQKAALIGGGVIGGGWAARFLLNGWDVTLYDPDPQAERKIAEVLAGARHALPALYDRALPPEGKLSFAASLEEAVQGAAWIQESVPERLELKHTIHARLAEAARPDALIGSSTSGFKPSELNAQGARCFVAHPFNPVYLLPLVELVGEADTCALAAEVLKSLGMYPLVVRKEIEAHIADRLLEAVWRESLWLVKDGIATTEEIDEAIRMGFGLRWAQMGLFETYRIAGGEAGMKHFMAQFGPALAWPWTKLMDVPEFNEDLVTLIANQSDAQSGDRTVRQLEAERDLNLVAILRALKKNEKGAGQVLREHEASLTLPEPADLPLTVERQVPASWLDYNGHVNETHALELGSQASDNFLELAGLDATYLSENGSFFTVENHLTYQAEIQAGDKIGVTTQVLAAQGKKLQLFHRIERQDATPLATLESLLIHVDLRTRQASEPGPKLAEALATYATAHAKFARPSQAGRFVGQRP